ncbi:MAG: hypothetical protein WD473_08150 [Acidimicrobiia bacterium]
MPPRLDPGAIGLANGGTIVVEPFTIPGVGHGCYFTDPAGLIAGLHQYDPDA